MRCCKITDYKIAQATTHSSIKDQVLLGILKDKGAPINGTFLLIKDPEYTFRCNRNYSTLTTVYYWDKLQG